MGPHRGVASRQSCSHECRLPTKPSLDSFASDFPAVPPPHQHAFGPHMCYGFCCDWIRHVITSSTGRAVIRQRGRKEAFIRPQNRRREVTPAEERSARLVPLPERRDLSTPRAEGRVSLHPLISFSFLSTFFPYFYSSYQSSSCKAWLPELIYCYTVLGKASSLSLSHVSHFQIYPEVSSVGP